MQRVAFLLGLTADDPATVAAYRARHDAIWPKMSAALHAAGFRNYRIFRHGTQLFTYCEVDDWAETLRRINADETNTQWQDYMADLLDVPIAPQSGTFYVLEELFHHA